MSVTIRDIAKIAGVSVSTVSKALNNNTAVKPSTMARIKQISEQLGYQPNIAAQSLVSKKSRTIGAVWPNVDRAILSTLASKINDLLNERGYSMILSINPTESAVQLFNRIQVDAVLIFDRSDPTSYDGNITSNVPIICYGEPASKGFPSVYVNRRKAVYKAVEHLAKLGHKRISYIGDISNRRISQQEKYLGFMDAVIEFGLTTDPNMTCNSNGLDQHQGYETAKKLLASSYKPTAIISGSYDLSIGIMQALQEKNIEMPYDISLISYDNLPQMGKLPTPLTSVGGQIDEVAECIVTSLLQMTDGEEPPALIQSIEPVLIERKSCAAPITELA